MLEYTQEGDVAVFNIDDGKANAVGYEFMEAVHGALDRAEKEAKAVVLVGRPGRFSAGFDLSIMKDGPDAAFKLVDEGGKMLIRLFSYPLPVVAACTGHALAAGAFILLSSDTRIGVEGDFKIGLNETAIGMTLPVFGFELSKARLSKRHLTAAPIQATIYDPAGAKDAGFLDEVVAADKLLPRAMEVAAGLAAVSGEAYKGNKLGIRREHIDTITASLT